MMKKGLAPVLVLAGLLAPLAFGQQKVGSNAYVDLYFGDWHAAAPRTTQGALVEYDILTRGNPFKPSSKGAVLRDVQSFTYATLAPNASTEPTLLDHRQEIDYFLSGRGTVSTHGETAQVSPNIAILMPAGLSYTLHNSGAVPLTLYRIVEPTQDPFKPNTKMLVRDENTIPITSSETGWARITKKIFVKSDGLSTLDEVSTVEVDALTMSQPFVGTESDREEVWTGISGTSVAMIGPFLRRQPPGVAYLHPPDNLAPTTNINPSEEDPVAFLVFVAHGKQEQP